MKIITLRGFDEQCNMALNKSFETANKYLCDKATSAHMLLHMLEYDNVAKAFKSDLHINAQDYVNTFLDMMQRHLSMADARRHITVSIDEISTELQSILSKAVYKAVHLEKEVDILSLYKIIVKERESEVWKVLSLMGINADEIDVSASNPLDDMPITSQFSVDYNILAQQGRFDPIESRDDEIDRTFEVMGRRIKNNPCVIGEAGVGKTAIIEGMAQRLIKGDVPSYMRNKHIISVDVSGIVSGAKYRGDFEERLNGILNEAAAHKNVVLFFDEMHMLMDAGVGSSDSSMNAANILKPAISRGDVQIIGATTFKEYKAFVEKDKAFERRLEPVFIKEPDVDAAIKMVDIVAPKYTEFHNCALEDGVVKAAVVLSDRYITDKRLPDKAITVIDETAARLKKSVHGNKFTVTVSDIKHTVSRATGIDVDDLDEKAVKKLCSLEDRLKDHVIGQDQAVTNVVKAIRRSKAGVKDPNKPIGSFLFVGPTGVGKTELTKALAIEFTNGIKNMIRFDMSEFMEKHTVSKLIGSPPGYVGYGEGGQLTEAVRRNPYSIILFDEIEKAHPDVFNIMLQILDDGILTDSQGLRVDFKNTVIIMTSNAGYGADQMGKKSIGFSSESNHDDNDPANYEKIAIKALESTFRPEFLNRLDKVIVFNKLGEPEIVKIVDLLLKQLKGRLTQSDIKVSWDKSVVNFIAKEGFSEKYGARNVKRKIQNTIEDELADKIISGEIKPSDKVKIHYKDGIDITVEHVVEIVNMVSNDVTLDKLKIGNKR